MTTTRFDFPKDGDSGLPSAGIPSIDITASREEVETYAEQAVATIQASLCGVGEALVPAVWLLAVYGELKAAELKANPETPDA